MKPGRELAGAIGTADAAELRKGRADRPESKAGRGFAACEGRRGNCGRTVEEVRKLNAPALEWLDPAPSLVRLQLPKRREVDPHQPPTGRGECCPVVAEDSAGRREGPRLGGAEVLTHPTFDRPPVVNPRRRGKMGAITLQRERMRRDRQAREAAQADLQSRPPHDLLAELPEAAPSPSRLHDPAAMSPADAHNPGGDAVIAAALRVLDGRLRVPGAVMGSPADVRAFLSIKLAQRDTEGFAVLFLDSGNAVIAFELMFEGTLSQTPVYPREVVRRALTLNAGAVILAHNHPSGLPEPSRADEILTHALKSALALVDVRVLDHLIVGRLQVVSMAERGMV